MKKIFIFFFVIMMIFFFQIDGFCEENYISDLKEKYSEKIKENIPDDTLDYLKKYGFDTVDFERMIDAEPKDIINFFLDGFRDKIDSPLKNLLCVSGALMISNVYLSYLTQDEKKGKIINVFLCGFIALTVSFPMTKLLSAGTAAVKMSSRFMLAFLPVLAGIIAACNKPLLALNYNSLTLYLAEGISVFSSDILLPFSGMLFSLITVKSVSFASKLSRIGETVKSAVTKTLAILSTVFVSVLSIKGILSNTADTLGVKGIKLLVGSLIPVIGGAISDAYGSIVNSISLLKSTVGIFGIIVVAAINLPVVTELFLWTVSLNISSIIADIFELTDASEYLKDISDTVKTFNIILLFCCMLFIVSTGILISFKESAV